MSIIHFTFDETWRAPGLEHEPRDTEWNMRRVSVLPRPHGFFWVLARLEATSFPENVGTFTTEAKAQVKALEVVAQLKSPGFNKGDRIG